MLGLVFLIVLGLWLVAIFLATRFGYRLGQQHNHPKLGAFIGFMLTIGGWMVYWILEYAYIQHKVTKLCEAYGGITVYISPEEWRQQIGEEEWGKSVLLGSSVQKEQENNIFYIDNKQFNPKFNFTDRILFADTTDYTPVSGIHQNEIAYYDSKTNSVLFVEHKIHPKTGGTENYLRTFKFWLRNIDGCPNKNDLEFSKKYLSSLN